MTLNDYLLILNLILSALLFYRMQPNGDPPTPTQPLLKPRVNLLKPFIKSQTPLMKPHVNLLKPFAKAPVKKKPVVNDDQRGWAVENKIEIK